MTEISANTAYSKIPRIDDYCISLHSKTMSRSPNFETIVMSSILLELSINVTIVPIGCQMAEISVKNGPIVIKSRTASISAAIFAAMFIKMIT